MSRARAWGLEAHRGYADRGLRRPWPVVYGVNVRATYIGRDASDIASGIHRAGRSRCACCALRRARGGYFWIAIHLLWICAPLRWVRRVPTPGTSVGAICCYSVCTYGAASGIRAAHPSVYKEKWLGFACVMATPRSATSDAMRDGVQGGSATRQTGGVVHGDEENIMNRHLHHTNNAVQGAPGDGLRSARPGEALPITRTLCDGLPAVVSYWKPTENELAILTGGGSIALWVVGATMPPIMLVVDPQ